ncbi:MAG TPA: hypothetical protein PK954_10075, partial [Anaerolineales bacterium]|nr:hypothetical protein [Anaerolineales bacterium]
GRIFSPDHTGAPALRAALAEHLATLKSFGIQLVGDGGFLWASAQAVGSAAQAKADLVVSDANSTSSIAQPLPVATLHLSGLVTASDLSGLTRGAAVRLAAGARLTPLAQEVLERQRARVTSDDKREVWS